MSLPNPTPQREHILHGMALFAGYGGLELGIDAAFGGCRTVCYVERESYAAATLVARMAEEAIHPAPIWDDVTTLDGRPWRGVVDIVSAGFPCQPFSAAGKRQGQADERWLWDDIERLLREIRPRWFVGENVPGLVSLGLGPVLRSLAVLGYDAEWGLLRASDVGASHRRERIFILARLADHYGHRRSEECRPKAFEGSSAQRGSEVLADASEARWRHRGESRSMANETSAQAIRGDQSTQAANDRERSMADATSRGIYKPDSGNRREGAPSRGPEMADADGERLEGHRRLQQRHDTAQQNCLHRNLFAPGPQDLDLWARVLAETPSLEPSVCRMADGSAAELDYRQDRLRACGNGVVPLQAAAAIRALADRAEWDLIP